MALCVASRVTGNGFTNWAQRLACEEASDWGILYETGYEFVENRGYSLSFRYRSNVVLSVVDWIDYYMYDLCTGIEVNEGSAKIVYLNFETTRYYGNVNNYLYGPIFSKYMGIGNTSDMAVNDYFEIDSVELVLNHSPNYPVCSTYFVDDMASTSATLNAMVMSYGLDTTVVFEWGTTIAYGNTVTAAESPISGSVDTDATVSAVVTVSSVGDEYHYRVKATNSKGTRYGKDVMFNSASLPAVTKNAYTSNLLSSIILNCAVTPHWLSTTVEAEYGLDTSYGSTVAAAESPVSGYGTNSCHVDLSSLTLDEGYHYRFKVTNSIGTVYSSDYTFSTWNDSFESASGSTPPTNWAVEQVSGSTLGITFVTSSTYPTVASAYSLDGGNVFVKYASFSLAEPHSTRLKKTLSYSTVDKTSGTLEFGWYTSQGYASDNDSVQTQWSLNGTDWNTIDTFYRYDTVNQWVAKSSTLPGGALGQSTVYIAFLFVSHYGHNMHIDHVRLVTS